MLSPSSVKRRKVPNSDSNIVSLPEDFQNTTGKVIKITLLNFLNHAHLSMTCCPNLNIIFGRNGHGKSAIVQGMALCFGGNGNSAGRNTTLNHYIKDYHLQNGPNFARIELHISNHGVDSYQQDLYGDIIVLSRTIYRNSSSFSIGGISSKKTVIDRKVLQQYLRHIKINITNPTTYMDQEMCKTFFFHSSSQNFYKYYCAAAGLDQMEERLEAEKNNLDTCKSELKVRKRVLLPDKEKINSLSKQIKIFEQKLNEWKKAKEVYKLSLYRVERDRYNNLKEKYDKYAECDPRNEIKKLEADIITMTNENVLNKSEIQELVSQSSKLKDKCRGISDTLSTYNDSINDIKSSIAALQSNISQIESQMNKIDDDEEFVPEMQSEINRIRKELDGYNSEYHDVNEQYQSLMSELVSLERLKYTIDSQINETKSELDELRHENNLLSQTINKKDNSKYNYKLLYGYNPVNVRESIKKKMKNNLFKYEPIGPVGDYLIVNPNVPCWKILHIIERHLKRIVLVWLVATESDRRELERILIDEGCDPCNIKIIKTNLFYSKIDLVSKVELELSNSKYQSVLYKYLSTNDIPKVLLNIMIESFNISKTAICKDGDEMLRVLNDDKLNIICAYTLDTIDFGKRVNGSLFLSPSDDKNLHYRFVRYANTTDSFDHLNEMNDRLTQGREREDMIKNIMKELNNKFKDNQSKLVSIKTKMNKLKKEKTLLLKKRTQTESDLNNQLLLNENEPTSKNDYNRKQGQININKNQIKRLEKNIRLYNRTLDDYLSDVNESMRLIKKYEDEFDQNGISYTGELPKKNPDEYLKIVNISRDLLSKVSNVSKDVELHLEHLRDKYNQAIESLKDKEQKMTETQNNYNNQKRNYTNRCKRFDEYRTRMESLAKKVFKHTLGAVCGYDGNLIFNDINRTLDIHIHNKQQSYDRVHVARDLKTLSGGEQSSIQLSMIHSLASISFSPVHMFDEIDVYMDENTRIKNVNAIVKFAEKNRNRQIFLLTPHVEFAKHISEEFPDITRLFNVSKDKI